LADISMP